MFSDVAGSNLAATFDRADIEEGAVIPGTTHDIKGRSTRIPLDKKHRRGNRPPPGQPWVWITQEMLESPAWRFLTENGRQFVFRIILEHMHHGGTENGNLPVTYNNFEEFGIRRKSIFLACNLALALGWIERTEIGGRSWADIRKPSKYSLTWLPLRDGTPATNRWQRLATEGQARARVDEVRRDLKEAKAERASRSQ